MDTSTTYNTHRTDATYEGAPVPNDLTQHLWAKADGFGVAATRCHVCNEQMEQGNDCTAEHYAEWLTKKVIDNPSRWINAWQIEKGDDITWEGEVWQVVNVAHGHRKTNLHLAKRGAKHSRAMVEMLASNPVKVEAYQVWFGQR